MEIDFRFDAGGKFVNVAEYGCAAGHRGAVPDQQNLCPRCGALSAPVSAFPFWGTGIPEKAQTRTGAALALTVGAQAGAEEPRENPGSRGLKWFGIVKTRLGTRFDNRQRIDNNTSEKAKRKTRFNLKRERFGR